MTGAYIWLAGLMVVGAAICHRESSSATSRLPYEYWHMLFVSTYLAMPFLIMVVRVLTFVSPQVAFAATIAVTASMMLVLESNIASMRQS